MCVLLSSVVVFSFAAGETRQNRWRGARRDVQVNHDDRGGGGIFRLVGLLGSLGGERARAHNEVLGTKSLGRNIASSDQSISSSGVPQLRGPAARAEQQIALPGSRDAPPESGPNTLTYHIQLSHCARRATVGVERFAERNLALVLALVHQLERLYRQLAAVELTRG